MKVFFGEDGRDQGGHSKESGEQGKQGFFDMLHVESQDAEHACCTEGVECKELVFFSED